MRNFDSNIELGSQPSSTRANRPPRVRISNPRHYNYHPQEDEESTQRLSQTAPQQPPNSARPSICSILWGNKVASFAIILMIYIWIVVLFANLEIFKNDIERSELRDVMRDDMPRLLNFMSADLKADPIMDIKAIDKKSTCPSGFEILKLGSWPRTVAGCLCEDGELLASPCESVPASTQKCNRDIPSTDSTEMFEWQNLIWCVKRAVHKVDYLRKAECRAEYKECYVGGCFRGDCPVTKIEIDSNNGVLSLEKSQGELPIINVQITLDEIPCFLRDLFKQSLGNISYELSPLKDKGCGKYGLDSQFSNKLASQSAYDAFMQNSFSYPVMHLPHFENYANNTISILSFTARMRTAKHDYCLSIDDKQVNVYIGFLEFPMILAICFVPPVLLLIFLCSLCFKRCRALEFDSAHEIMKTFTLWSVLNLILGVLLFVYYNEEAQRLQLLKEYFERYRALDCFGEGQGTMVINDYLEICDNIETGFEAYRIYFMSCAASALVSFAYHSYVFLRKKFSSQRSNSAL